MAWRENITHLIVESDSKILVDMITDNCKFSGTIHMLVRRIRKLLNLIGLSKLTILCVKASEVQIGLLIIAFRRILWILILWRLLLVSFRIFYLIIFPGLACLWSRNVICCTQKKWIWVFNFMGLKIYEYDEFLWK